MSKPKANDKPEDYDPGLNEQNRPADQTVPADNNNDQKADPKKEQELPTVEEHAVNLKVGAPVFAAVMQSNNWASGKRMPAADFEKAVKNFLGASMGGA